MVIGGLVLIGLAAILLSPAKNEKTNDNSYNKDERLREERIREERLRNYRQSYDERLRYPGTYNSFVAGLNTISSADDFAARISNGGFHY